MILTEVLSPEYCSKKVVIGGEQEDIKFIEYNKEIYFELKQLYTILKVENYSKPMCNFLNSLSNDKYVIVAIYAEKEYNIADAYISYFSVLGLLKEYPKVLTYDLTNALHRICVNYVLGSSSLIERILCRVDEATEYGVTEEEVMNNAEKGWSK
jgi:hypothetical protein